MPGTIGRGPPATAFRNYSLGRCSPRQLGKVLPGGKRPQAKTVSVFLAGDEEFVVRPRAPTVVAADTLLLEIEVQGDVVAVRQQIGRASCTLMAATPEA